MDDKYGSPLLRDGAVGNGNKTTCNIAYCSALATWQVEIQGFFKQYMCDKHTQLLGDAISPSYWYGSELLSK